MKNLFYFFVLILFSFSLNFCSYEKDKLVEEDNNIAFCDTAQLTYDNGVNNIINNNCTNSGCHNAGSPFKDFTTYAGINQVISNGKFSKRVFDGNPTFMPPSGFSNSEDKEKLKCWIEKGAKEN